jgi:hypothetical protein
MARSSREAKGWRLLVTAPAHIFPSRKWGARSHSTELSFERRVRKSKLIVQAFDRWAGRPTLAR